MSCGDDQPIDMGRGAYIMGSVFYNEGPLPPDDAEVEVQLQDVSRADASAIILARHYMDSIDGSPFHFRIAYDPERIDSSKRYALRATIANKDELFYSSTEHIDPFGKSPIRIKVSALNYHKEVRTDPELGAVQWQLLTLGGKVELLGTGGSPLTLEFDPDAMNATGFSGCNRYSGTYTRDEGGTLNFWSLRNTRMACADGADHEGEYMAMLSGVTGFRREGQKLILLAGEQALASFKAN